MGIALLESILKHYTIVPEVGYTYTLKAVGRDLRTKDNYQWKIGINKQEGPADGEACGMGLHLGNTWYGLSSGGHGLRNLLVVRYKDKNVLGQDGGKVRVSKCRAVQSVDGWEMIRLYGAEADLCGANLSGSNLYGANLYGANLSETNLSETNLSGANLSETNLSGANLYRSNLSGANLTRANLTRANLYMADLYGAIGLAG